MKNSKADERQKEIEKCEEALIALGFRRDGPTWWRHPELPCTPMRDPHHSGPYSVVSAIWQAGKYSGEEEIRDLFRKMMGVPSVSETEEIAERAAEQR